MKSRSALTLFLAVTFLFALPVCGQSTATPEPAPFEPVLDRLHAIGYVPLDQWRAHPADLPHGEDPTLDISAWPQVKVRQEWTDGPRWVRTEILVPEKLSGYDLRGATLDLDLHATSDDFIQVSVFSNGTLISRTDEDTQLPITLTHNAQPGEKFAIAVRIIGTNAKTSLYRAQLLVHAAPGRPDPQTLRMQMLSALPLISAYPSGKEDRMQQLAAAVNAVDVSALDRGDQAAFDASLRASQQKLEALRPFLSQFTIRVTGNSHIDMAWLWPWTETVEVVRNTFSSVLQLMREYPELTFSMGSAQTFSWMEEKYPEMFKEIQQRVKEGRWEIVGGMWVEPDLNMPDGEALVRQLLYGKRYFRQKFGVDVKIGWNPDSFGYNWQLPQIYRRAGVDSFVTQKMYWNDTTKFPYKLFWWQSPDGSRVLTYFPHDYANEIDGEKMAADLAMYAPSMWKADAGRLQAAPGSLEMMYLFGVGDHGGGPTRVDLDTAVQLQQPALVYPKVEFGTAGAFLADLNKRSTDLNLPTWKDELYFEYHRGVQTTQAETKHRNRKTEVMMLNAEKLASIGTLFGDPYPQKEFNSAWKNLLFNEFHDVLPGSGIAVNYVDAARRFAEVQRIAQHSINESLAHLAARVNAPATSLLVFNPLSWKRTDVVEADVQFPHTVTQVRATGADGKPLDVEVLSADASTNTLHLRVLVKNVPPLGYELVSFTPVAAKPKIVSALHASASGMENEFFRIAIDAKSGCITSVFDKRSKTEALGAPDPGDGVPANASDGKPCGDQLQVFVDKPKKWDAWNIDADFIKQHTDLTTADEVKLVEDSPLRAVVRVRKHFGESTFIQDITMYSGVPRIDVRTQAEWHEKHKLLKVAFPLSAHNEKATFEIPYGSIERPTTRRTPAEQAKFEVPAQRWADLSDATHGFSLLNDSKYGYDAKDNVLRLSLLRSPEWPDPHADEGHHEFVYSLYPHGGDWKQAMTIHRGYELNDPLLAVAVSAHTGALPAARSFFSADAKDVIISAIKKDEDDDGLTLRMFEWGGEKSAIGLHLPQRVSIASETDLMEAPLKDGDPANIGPFVIKSLKVQAAKP